MVTGFRLLSLLISQVALPSGFRGLAMLIKELRGMPVRLRCLVVNGGCTFVYRDMPALMLFMLAVCITHNPRLSHDISAM